MSLCFHATSYPELTILKYAHTAHYYQPKRMSFIGSCTGLHSAKENEKTKLRNKNLMAQAHQMQARNVQSQSCSQSYSNLFHLSFLPKANYSYFSNINNETSHPIISSRFQQQTFRHQ
eukprot:1121797_1